MEFSGNGIMNLIVNQNTLDVEEIWQKNKLYIPKENLKIGINTINIVFENSLSCFNCSENFYFINKSLRFININKNFNFFFLCLNKKVQFFLVLNKMASMQISLWQY